MHRLSSLLTAAALGAPPAADGMVEVVSSAGIWPCVVAFTAHELVACDVPEDDVRAHLGSFLGAAMDVRFLHWLGSRLDRLPGVLDVTLAAPPPDGAPPIELVRIDTPRQSPGRVDVRWYTDPEGRALAQIGRGLAGRWELGFEVDASSRGSGLGREVAESARSKVPGNAPLFAQVAPGNAASLRALAAAGFRPVGAEISFVRKPNHP